MAYIIMDANFKRLCEITRCKSILWHELYLDPTGGDFQLNLPANRYLTYIKKGHIIVNTASEKVGIVDTYDIRYTPEEGHMLTVTGLMAESLLIGRTIFPSVSVTGTLDAVVAALIRQCVTQPANGNRAIANFAYKGNATFADRLSKQFTGAALSDAVKGLCSMYACGYVVTLNAEQNGFEMRLTRGKDRSLGQSENTRVAFSTAEGDVTEFAYKTSNRGAYTHVICAGEGEGSDRKYVIYPPTSTASTTGINRREIYLDRKNISSKTGDDSKLPDSVYLSKLEAEAAEKLAGSSTTEACEGTIRLSRYTYGKDFSLGDIVSVQDDVLGLYFDTRILGALIAVDENGAQEITVEMGNLTVTDVSDPEEIDPEEEEIVEPVIDTSAVVLGDDIRPFAFTGGDLKECDGGGNNLDAHGKPAGWLHIFDNGRAEIVVTACTQYLRGAGGTVSLGTLTFTLTPEQHGIVGDTLMEEMGWLTFPVVMISAGEYRMGSLDIRMTGYSLGEDEAGNTRYKATCSTALHNTPSGVFALFVNGIRAVFIEEIDQEEEEKTWTTWDISEGQNGGVIAKIDADDWAKATTLVISSDGSDAMKDFTEDDPAPWESSLDGVQVVIEDGVYNIGNRAFFGCGITEIDLPESVHYIGEDAFYRCTNLTRASMGDQLTFIGKSAFQACSSLVEINLSESLYVIDQMAFLGTAIESITIPAECNDVGFAAFQSCYKMQSCYIECPASATFWAGSNCFDFQSEAATIYVCGESIATAIAGTYDPDVTSVVVI